MTPEAELVSPPPGEASSGKLSGKLKVTIGPNRKRNLLNGNTFGNPERPLTPVEKATGGSFVLHCEGCDATRLTRLRRAGLSTSAELLVRSKLVSPVC